MEKVKVLKVDSEAVGVARINNKPILIDKVLPDEEVEVYSFLDKGKYCLVTNYKVVSESCNRVQSICKFYDRCFGCNLQHSSMDFQKKFKINLVKDSLKHIANINVDNITFIDSEKNVKYRNKIVFACEGYKLGMYKKNSHDFFEIDYCMLISDRLNFLVKLVGDWIKKYKQNLNHVGFREINDKYQCILISEIEPDNIEELQNMLLENNFDCQIVFNRNDASKDLITNDIKILHGDDLLDRFYDIIYPVSANSFLQVNRVVSEKLYDEITSHIKGEVIINAYSGAGVLTAILAKNAKKVYGIEIVKNAHDNAEQLKLQNKITNMCNFCGKSEIIIPQILKNEDKVTLVVDPPRKGIDNKLINFINNCNKIDKLVYVACSPNSLAKNLRDLTNYKIRKITLFDMFPQTSHVETLVVLIKK